MPDTDPTPDTPLTIGDRLAWFRGEMGERFAAMMGSPFGTLANLANGLDAMMGEGEFNTLAAVSADVRRLEATIDSNWPLMMGRLSDLSEQLDSIQAVLGAAPYSSTETGNLRALMLALVTCCAKKGQLPDGLPEGSVTSGGTVTQNGRRYLTWGTIAGLITGNAETLPANTQLTPVATWTGYRVFVQTDAPEVSAEGTGETFPANSWFTLPGAAPWTWYVPASYSAVGFIALPPGAATEYVTLNSTPLNLDTWFIQFPGFERDGADMLGDGSGRSFRFPLDTQTRVSGGPGGVGDPRLAWEPGVHRLPYPGFDLGVWYHFGGVTTSFGVYSYYSGFSLDWADGIFPGSIEL